MGRRLLSPNGDFEFYPNFTAREGQRPGWRPRKRAPLRGWSGSSGETAMRPRICAFLLLVVPLVLALLVVKDPPGAVASDGSDGPFHPTSNVTLTPPADGAFDF